MKLRSSFVALALSLLATGCPENTYPAGEKDAYPLTELGVFYATVKPQSEHDKAEALRAQLADVALPADKRQQASAALTDQAKKEKDELDSIENCRPIVRAILAGLFGSPEHPARPATAVTEFKVAPFFAPSAAKVEEPSSPLDEGRRLYKQHCMHCHGFYGFGDGPTANFLLPKPRDFRFGKVKFTSTKGGMRAVHDDLVRTIAQGIQGTMMPAFGPTDGVPRIGIFAGAAGPPGFDVEAVASYVEVLLMRGSIEQQLVAMWASDDGFTADTAQSAVNSVLRDWQDATAGVITPEVPRPDNFEESAKNGAVLFGYEAVTEEAKKNAKAGCLSCHGIHGLGVDSPPSDIGAADQAGADKTLLQPNDYKLPSMPLNLTFGVYRGGRRPLDLYRHIAGGIKGTPMPGQAGNLSPVELWNVVDFVCKLGMPKTEKPE